MATLSDRFDKLAQWTAAHAGHASTFGVAIAFIGAPSARSSASRTRSSGLSARPMPPDASDANPAARRICYLDAIRNDKKPLSDKGYRWYFS